MFNTNYVKIPVRKETGGRESKVEKAGYIPLKRKIQDMTNAGQRLNDSRSQNYDTFENIDLYPNPLRAKEVDFTDIQAVNNMLIVKYNMSKERKKPSVTPPVTPPVEIPPTP